MRTATTVEAASFDRWSQQRDFVVEAEKLGLDVLWVAEAWGSDAPSALGYYAACTERMLLGSGVMQVGTRTPVAVAQAAITLSNLSGGRFFLGLGVSGPQVMKGCTGFRLRVRSLVLRKRSRSCVRWSMAGRSLTRAASSRFPGPAEIPFR
jgi:alkanesulfonate monooxygenase SsuD/methylene tetrahydromethanopterin reductase-like flavin-dependent oxidoreductase (luciferase family)